MKKLLPILSIFISVTAYGQLFDKYAGEFMAAGVGSRYLGLGHNAVSIVSDPYAVYWNPAGLVHTNYFTIGFMHNERFGGLASFDFLTVTYPQSQTTTFGLGVLRSAIDNIPDTRNGWDSDRNQPKEGFTPSYFTASDYVVYGSIAISNWLPFPVGASAKMIYRGVGSFGSAYGFGFDIGTQMPSFLMIDDLTFGFIARDVTSTVMYWNSGKTELIAPSFETGISHQFEIWGGLMTSVLSMNNLIESRKYSAQTNLGPISGDFKGGIEYNWDKKLAVRAGLNDLGNLTAGAGFKINAMWLDYAFESYDQTNGLGNSHKISFSLELDKDQFARP